MRRTFECFAISVVSLLACATTRDAPDATPKLPGDVVKIDAVTPADAETLDAPKEPADVPASSDIPVVEVTPGVNDADAAATGASRTS